MSPDSLSSPDGAPSLLLGCAWSSGRRGGGGPNAERARAEGEGEAPGGRAASGTGAPTSPPPGPRQTGRPRTGRCALESQRRDRPI